jgi:type I restriction enzyme S subunit
LTTALESTQLYESPFRIGQVILDKAFRGELVPQDPNDEPASAMMRKVVAEHGRQPSARHRRP